MEKRTKGYGNFINGKKTYSACTNLTIYKRLNGSQYYRDLTHFDFNSFTLPTPELFENFNSEFVFVFSILTQEKRIFVEGSLEDLFAICFNRYVARNVSDASLEFNLIQHIKENAYLRFVVNEKDIMFFQSNKIKGERNEYRIQHAV